MLSYSGRGGTDQRRLARSEMDHAISIDGMATRVTPNERLEALKARHVPTPNDPQPLGDGDLGKFMDQDLYEAVEKGDAEEFIGAIEKVSESRKLAPSLIFDQVTPSGNSLLHVAASSGREDVMELILFHYPYLVTRKNSSEDTPLHVAVREGRLEATRMIIRPRRDSEIIYWKNKDSKSPLYLAVEAGDTEILGLLLEASARDKDYAVKIQGMSPVFAALEEGKSVILEEIIDRLPKLLRARGDDGGTPLHFAASVGNVAAVQLLLSKCRYLALQTDKNGSYPIHIAVASSKDIRFSTFKTLLDHTWPDLAEIKNKKGQNILHVAAKGGNDGGVRYVFEECAEPVVKKLVNSKDVDGNTPLHLASMHNHWGVLFYLTRDKRIELELRNNDNLTALDVALESESSSWKTPTLRGSELLIGAGARRSKVGHIREQSSGASKPSRAKWIDDEVNTRLVVATLVASVTFTAGFTLPGGYNASGDRHPGTATLLHKGVFHLFVISDSLAMYNSILAVVALLWGHGKDIHRAEKFHEFAWGCLYWALISMAVAFLSALIVAVGNMALVLSIAVLYIIIMLGYLSTLE